MALRKLFLTPFARPLCRSGQLRSSAQQLQYRFYRAAVLKELGKPFSLEDIKETPSISDQSVLVKVRSAGVNNADLAMQKGVHHASLKLPCVGGFEFAGEVLKTGGKVQSVAVGDRVLGLMTKSTGAFAEECVACEDEIYRIPHSLSYDIAASIPVAYGTALLALKRYADVKEGQTVLVLTSQGSSGIAAVDLAVNLFKCQVIACTDSDEKSATIRPKGVQFTLEIKDDQDVDKIMQTVLERTGNKGADVVIDTVGGLWLETSLKCVKPGGYVCTLGFSSSKVPSVSALELIKHQAILGGVWLGGYAKYRPDRFHALIEDTISYIDEQCIEPSVGAIFGFDKINEALKYVENQSSIGKVVLNFKND